MLMYLVFCPKMSYVKTKRHFNKYIYKPYKTVLFMALLKALCWALIFILRKDRLK